MGYANINVEYDTINNKERKFHNGNPRVKLYAKEDGSFNGEALVVYIRKPDHGAYFSIAGRR